jgi:hypothetical protein
MIHTFNMKGASYIKYNEVLPLQKVKIVSVQGAKLEPQQQFYKIGTKKRSSFEVDPKFRMIYEGLIKIDKVTYAVFDTIEIGVFPQLELFESEWHYRYAFPCVFQRKKLVCFLIFTNTNQACRDVIMDVIE